MEELLLDIEIPPFLDDTAVVLQTEENILQM
jgi:hypothetical protein